LSISERVVEKPGTSAPIDAVFGAKGISTGMGNIVGRGAPEGVSGLVSPERAVAEAER